MAPHANELTDRQARAVIVAAEELGFRREPHLIFWQYDESLHADANRARTFLEANHRNVLRRCLSAPDPIPPWVAAQRITTERGGFHYGRVAEVVDAALERGLDLPEPDLPLLEWQASWDRACHAIALLWEHDPEVIPELLGEYGRIAPLPETAVTRCPSGCDDGWVPHPYAGPLSPEPPDDRAW